MRSAHSMMPEFGLSDTNNPRVKAMRQRAKDVLRAHLGSEDGWNEAWLNARMSDPDFLATLQNAATQPGTTPDAAATLTSIGVDPQSQAGAAIRVQSAAIAERDKMLEYRRLQGVLDQYQAQKNVEQSSGVVGFLGAFAQTAMAAAEVPFEQITNFGRMGINALENGDFGGMTAMDALSNTSLSQMAMGAADYYSTGSLDNVGLDQGTGFFLDPESKAAQVKKEYDRMLMGTQYMGDQKVTRQVVGEDGKVQNVTEMIGPPASIGQWGAEKFISQDRTSTAYSVTSGLVDLTTRAFDPSMYVGAKAVNSTFTDGQNAVAKMFGKPSWRVRSEADQVTAIAKAQDAVRADIATDNLKAATTRSDGAQKNLDEVDQEWRDVIDAVPERPETLRPDVEDAVSNREAARTMAFADAYLGRTRAKESAANNARIGYEAIVREVDDEASNLRWQVTENRFREFDAEDVMQQDPIVPKQPKAIEGRDIPLDPARLAMRHPQLDTSEVTLWTNSDRFASIFVGERPDLANEEFYALTNAAKAKHAETGFTKPVEVIVDRTSGAWKVTDEGREILRGLETAEMVPLKMVDGKVSTVDGGMLVTPDAQRALASGEKFTGVTDPHHSAINKAIDEIAETGEISNRTFVDLIDDWIESPNNFRVVRDAGVEPTWHNTDTVGHGYQFHGGGEDALKPGGEQAFGGDGNLVSDGYYTTDGHHVARSYDPDNVYLVEEVSPVRQFDLEQRVPGRADIDGSDLESLMGLWDESIAAGNTGLKWINDNWARVRELWETPTKENLDEIVNGLKGAVGKELDTVDRESFLALIDQRVLEETLGLPGDEEALTLVNFFENLSARSKDELTPAEKLLVQVWEGRLEYQSAITWMDLLDEMRGIGYRSSKVTRRARDANPDIPSGRTVFDDAVDQIKQVLGKMHGIGAFRHKGGVHVGGVGEHNVVIYWDAANQIKLHKIDPDSPYDPVAMMGKGGPGATRVEGQVPFEYRTVVYAQSATDDTFDLVHAPTGKIVGRGKTAEEAEQLSERLSRMPGYARTMEYGKVRNWDKVEAEKMRREVFVGKDDAAKAADEAPAGQPQVGPGRPETPALESAYQAHAERAARYEGIADDLQRRRAEINDRRKAAAADASRYQAEREQAEREAEALSNMLGGRKESESVREHLSRVSGMTDDTVDVDMGIAYTLNSKDIEWLMRGLAKLDNPADIYRLAPDMPAAVVDDLVAAGSPEKVRKALATALARGDMDENTGRLRGIRLAAREALKANPDIGPNGLPEKIKIPWMEKFFAARGVKPVQWGNVSRYGKVPWAASRHVADRDGMIDLTWNTIAHVFNMKTPGAKPIAYTLKGGVETAGPKGLKRRFAQEGIERFESVTYKTKAGEEVTAKPKEVLDNLDKIDLDGEFSLKRVDTDVETSGDEFMDTWLNKMIAAKDSLERKQTWDDMLSELVTIAGRKAGLEGEDLTKFQDALALSKFRANNTRSLLSEVRAATKAETGSDKIYIDGVEFKGDAATLEAELSDRVMSPNWQEMRRVMKSVAEARKLSDKEKPGALATTNEVVTDLFERYWRMSVIAFRGSYIIRNMGDIHIRMFLHDHPSAFTSPQGIIALGASNWKPKGKIGQWLKKQNDAVENKLHLRRGDSKLDGESLFDDLDEDVEFGNKIIIDEAQYRQQVFVDRMSHFDPGSASPRAGQHLGYQPQSGGDRDFYNGWAFQIGKLQHSPIAVNVLEIMRGKVPPRIEKIAQAQGLSPEDAYVHYLVKDKGRPYLDKVLAGGRKIREMLGDPANGDVLLGRQLKEGLFGDNSYSYASRWRRHTFGLDEEFMGVVMQGINNRSLGGQALRDYNRKVAKAIERVASREEYLDEEGKIVYERLPVLTVDAPIYGRQDKNLLNRAEDVVDGAFDGFFGFSGKIESAYGYGPEFRYSKWDRAAELAGLLNADEAEKLLKVARKELGHGLPNSWSKRTLKKLERNAKGKGNGAFTLGDLEYVTDKFAARVVKDLFYDARARNQWAHAFRLIFPFLQPWANSIRIWSREAIRHPNRVYAAGVVYSAGQGRNSNWLMDDASNPNDAFFYRHPKNGQMTVGIPMMAQGIAAAGNALGLLKGQTIDPSMLESGISMSSMNLIFQGGIAPGVGPFVQIPAALLEEHNWYRSYVPDQVKNIISPQVNTDPQSDGGVLSKFLPAWLAGGLGAVGLTDFSGKVKKYVQPSMTYLLTETPPGKYYSLGPNGEVQMSEDQQARLASDAEALASTILFGRSILQNVSPGAPIPEVLVKATDGKVLSQAIVTQEYYDELGKTGDRGLALMAMGDRYGADILFTLIPTRNSQYTPTGDAWEFLKANPEAANDYGSVLPLLAVGGGYSAHFARWQNARSGSPSLEAREMVPYVSKLHEEAQLARLDQKYRDRLIGEEEYDVRTAAIKEGYSGTRGPDSSWDGSEPDRQQLVKAATDPNVQAAFPKTTKSILMYEEYRRQGLERANAAGYKTLESDACLPIKDWLLDRAMELAKENPDFIIPFKRIYKSEVDD